MKMNINLNDTIKWREKRKELPYVVCVSHRDWYLYTLIACIFIDTDSDTDTDTDTDDNDNHDHDR